MMFVASTIGGAIVFYGLFAIPYICGGLLYIIIMAVLMVLAIATDN